MSVGMPVALKLEEFGSQLIAAFDEVPYHVGSSLTQKTGWRDVDIRTILPDEKWDQLGLGDPKQTHRNEKWVSLCLAFSALGRDMTGLPIDFQLQRSTEANAEHAGVRAAIGFVPLRYKQYDKTSG